MFLFNYICQLGHRHPKGGGEWDIKAKSKRMWAPATGES